MLQPLLLAVIALKERRKPKSIENRYSNKMKVIPKIPKRLKNKSFEHLLRNILCHVLREGTRRRIYVKPKLIVFVVIQKEV